MAYRSLHSMLACLSTLVLSGIMRDDIRAADQIAVFGDIVVARDQPLGGWTAPRGYTDCGFTIQNRSANQSHDVTLLFPDGTRDYAWGIHLRSMKTTMRLGPGSTQRAFLLQPNIAIDDGSSIMAVTIDGIEQESTPIDVYVSLKRGPNNSPYYTRGSSGTTTWRDESGIQHTAVLPFEDYRPNVLISPTVNDSHSFQQLYEVRGIRLPPDLLRDGTTREGTPVALPPGRAYEWQANGHTHFATEQSPVTSWSPGWLAYSALGGIMVSAQDMKMLDDTKSPVQSALLAYTECGGSLVVIGPWKVPESWEHRKMEVLGGTSYYPGFGQCLVINKVMPGKFRQSPSTEQLQPMAESWLNSELPWKRQIMTIVDANRAFPVVESLDVPVRGLFVIMLVFALTIGPGNLYLLSRTKRRIWMLWTVPVISLVTCLGVIGYMLATEGWRGYLRSEGLTILDETAQRASTIGWTAVYAPVTPGDGLHFSQETELTPHLAQGDSGRTIHGPGFELDWTVEQHLTRGWVRPRVPAHFLVRKCQTRPEKVHVFKAADGSLRLVNGLGAGVRKLWLADRQGKIYVAADIASGGETVLAPTGETLAQNPSVDAFRTAYDSDWLKAIRSLSDKPRHYLLPGCYIAALDGAPFIEDCLRKIQRKQASSVVYGIMREPVE
jgi:hypothetical protein